MEFGSVVDAVRCPAEIQRGMLDRNSDVADERRIRFLIGVNLGDVIADAGDIFGDALNVAARLEALAEPSGVGVSHTVRDQIHDKVIATQRSRLRTNRSTRSRSAANWACPTCWREACSGREPDPGQHSADRG